MFIKEFRTFFRTLNKTDNILMLILIFLFYKKIFSIYHKWKFTNLMNLIKIWDKYST